MLVVTVRPGKHVDKLILKFDQYLHFNNLSIVAQRREEASGNIELVINAGYFLQFNRACALAERFFADRLISISNTSSDKIAA